MMSSEVGLGEDLLNKGHSSYWFFLAELRSEKVIRVQTVFSIFPYYVFLRLLP
jgi:hypothetical protein